jgi:hypothetical protein
LSPNPPSLGKQRLPQQTLAFVLTSLPDQKNLLNFCSKSCTTFLGKRKTRAQNICRLTNTEERSCNLPAKDSFLANQE